MATEVILLLGFQAVYGYVFDELALIIAGFMAGIALGSWFALRQTNAKADLARLLAVQIAIALSPVLVIAAIVLMSAITRDIFIAMAAHVLFPVLAVLCGLAGGYQFPTAMRVYSRAVSHDQILP
jgi:predicted membrane-bound spermidine synthase